MKAAESKYNACMYFASGALARQLEKLAIEHWKQVDLPPSHAYLLMLALEEPGIQPTSISRHLRLTPSTITRLIEKLEEKMLVMRITEGKVTKVYPTPGAEELYPALLRCNEQFAARYCHLLGLDESGKLAQSMMRMADKLSN
ncbi:MAG: MarR family transcriptional regulator [Candidatus Pseudobacter hemicellulosilyticus]|uniref:MarR family transcriptional regulator n=1 Tax=Candidatus Pseudobacter hemicellulosilyticus TaxID=3121375 RepID=A0AAJ6BJI7_9BACT|nr:MAG: MarR family transcriptional regulator [Pseudobacter sp.]